jgi:hypothetical protein
LNASLGKQSPDASRTRSSWPNEVSRGLANFPERGHPARSNLDSQPGLDGLNVPRLANTLRPGRPRSVVSFIAAPTSSVVDLLLLNP